MSLMVYGHPFSSYSQKVLTALYENATEFTFRQFGEDDPAAAAEWEALWPMQRFPILVDAGRTVVETTIIIEYLDLHHPGLVRLMPEDRESALETRLMDRFFDNYIMTPMLKLAFNESRAEAQRDPISADEARAMLDKAYSWLDGLMAGRLWAAGETFSLADCAAAPALLFGHWAHGIGEERAALHRYRAQLLARPSFARVVEESRAYRRFFPLGAPDQD